ncbi:MAG: hypothetical protein QP830_00595 [Actinotignum sanguinis]|uniref:DUF6667 domain-containing protein n=1 Tax=Actinotignum sanguinis TaxID=1445614 RepID=UPI00254AA776|nr:DUF6667 domain-containing protein [Actinotignum sanguinis]MDK8287051.1 hypothetical protein [Actinotignum sanguinis]MDK8650928.1 hypothetical protein [Actinotignum sanguinis]MDK8800807.1 hypothetical protein [Actinotignum sanguinis]
MGFQGYALMAVVVLLMVYVIPGVYRQRVILADVRIDERYSPQLRTLALPNGTVGVETGGPTGAIFFRKPEVIMAENDERDILPPSAGRNVRTLARERARRKARISQRAANRQRGFVVAGALGLLIAVLGALAFTTTMPRWIFYVAVGIGVLYGAGFGYLLSEMGKATARDREDIAELTEELGIRKTRGAQRHSRRPARPRPGRSAVSAASAHSALSAASAALGSDDLGALTADASRSADLGRSADLSRSVASGSAATMPTAASAATGGADAAGEGEAAGDARDTQAANAEEQETGVNPGKARSRNAGARAPKRRSGISVTLEQGIIAAEDFAPIAGSRREQAEKLPKRFVAGAVPRRQLPSYTLKPQIQQRTVAPYQAPEAPVAPVPYRPKEIGERVTFVDAAAQDVAAAAAPAGQATPQSSAPAPKSEAAVPSAQATAPAHDGLAGGAALDELLRKRRA